MTELEALGLDIDVEALGFGDVMRILVGYAGDVLMSQDVLNRLDVPDEHVSAFNELLADARTFVSDAASAEQTTPARVRAWNLHDSLPESSDAQRLAEIVVLCTYDRNSAEFDTFGPEPMIESIFTSLARLGSGYCRSLRLYALQIDRSAS